MWVVLRKMPQRAMLLQWCMALVAAICAAILCSTLLQQSVYAAEATWRNGAIQYNNLTLNGPEKAPANSPLGLGEGTEYYISRPDANGKVVVAAFARGTNIDAAERVAVTEYAFTPPNTYQKQGAERSITIDKRSGQNGNQQNGNNAAGANGNQNGEQNNEEASSCAVNGLGYILCPIMGYIADITDKVFSFLQYLLTVQPITNDGKSNLFKAWSIMRNIANVAFIIAFLVVIYSHITSYGLKAYDVRYILPRMVIAAILVNVSYYICAALVDISNIIGSSLQDMLYSIRMELVSDQSQNIMIPSWKELTAYSLSAGAIGAIGAWQVSEGGLLWQLIPILVVVLIAVLVTVAVLAARQAIITICVILSPFAFVAFILPGTQKYFEKWKDIFQTMLLMYPMFSILFGGSQLAGYLIAQNADRLEVLLIAMFVHMAPLVITPFLIKFSGSLLGRFAGIVNNPTRGVLDSAKNYARENRQLTVARRKATKAPLSGLARMLDRHRMRTEADKAKYDLENRTNFAQTAAGRRAAIGQVRAEDLARKVENMNKARYAELRMNDPGMQHEAVQGYLAEQNLNRQQARVDSFMEELQTKQGRDYHAANNASLAQAADQLGKVAQDQRIIATRRALATDVARAELADAMVKNEGDIQTIAAGFAGEKGRTAVTARAVADLYDDFGKSVKSVESLMGRFRLSGADIEKLAMREGGPLVKRDENGAEFTFDFRDDYTFDAAVGKLMAEGNTAQKKELVKRSGLAEYADVRSTIADGVKSTMLGAMPQIGGRALDIIRTTGINPNDPAAHMAEITRDFVEKGKGSQEVLAGMDPDGLKLLLRAISPDANGKLSFDGVANKMEYLVNREKLIENAALAINNQQLKGSIRDNTEKGLRAIKHLDPFAK